MKSLKVLIAEDHKVVTMGTIQILHDAFSDINTASATDMLEVLGALNDETYDLLILDINIPGGDRPAMIGEIRLVQPDIKILIFSGYDEFLYAYPYLQAGADGYLSKNSAEKEFKVAIDRLMSNVKYISEAMQQQIINNLIGATKRAEEGLKVLTEREMAILHLLLKGKKAAEIGKEYSLTVSTVSSHKLNIYRKLGVSNLAELIEYVRAH
ncbi:response regulator [Dyadobacter arcticus]|uniref:DNA-binding NarL/FixJ family response regulator n=1 Tax=Dyadobacter arcticus TaxID=1078754 RepID=A0ABX0UR56_9BACT|nr:response regulator transcription factor [Dyadobacter arcticus]NIJ55474.1 DNA-binding NarL/FixJ family response regulator [Dyadobacter arcticus]